MRDSLVVRQLEARDDAVVPALGHRPLGMARGDPRDAPLGIGDDVGEPLRRDAEDSRRLRRRVRERVQAVRALGEVDGVPGESRSSPSGVRTVGRPTSTKNISSTP
jgi:hypothetical protein